MEEKKLTDEEIVKALEFCTEQEDCVSCKYEDCIDCRTFLMEEALNLIHRLQDENEAWRLKSKELETAWEISSSNEERLQKQVDELKEELQNLDWYKMWHKKFKKEIDDLTLELETYRPTKLSGNGQCKCSECGVVCWTDWFSRYKGQTLCDKCLNEIIATEEKQAVKDTAKECRSKVVDLNIICGDDFRLFLDNFELWVKERYGVEVE